MSPALLVVLLLAADPPVTAEQRAVALQLVELVQPESAYRAGLQQMMDQMVPSMEAQARATGKPLPPDYKQKMNAALLEVMPYAEMKQWSADIYARRFTVPELKQLVAFYRTPLGRKVAAKLPEIMGEVGKKITAVVPERLPGALRHQGLIGTESEPPPPPRTLDPASQQQKL
jgi:hypothetical protein